jgi:8-oxo-dGTP diphosphatase
MISEVQQYYGGKIRVRICGLNIKDNSLLMINHHGITNANFWAPPGGGLEFGEKAEDCLVREFDEETGLKIKVNNFLFACEMIQLPLHAIELFFSTTLLSGDLKSGADLESGSPAILNQATYISWNQIQSLPSAEIHGIFKHLRHPSEIIHLKGHFQVG